MIKTKEELKRGRLSDCATTVSLAVSRLRATLWLGSNTPAFIRWPLVRIYATPNERGALFQRSIPAGTVFPTGNR